MPRHKSGVINTGSPQPFAQIGANCGNAIKPDTLVPREQLRTAMNSLREHRDFHERWRRDPFDRDNRIDTLLSELALLGPLAAESSWPEDFLATNPIWIRLSLRAMPTWRRYCIKPL